MIRYAVWWLMDHICADWNGHAFFCWNEPRWINRIWGWSLPD